MPGCPARIRAAARRPSSVCVGGARPDGGSGLAGLALRLEALGGRLQVTSPGGGPTEIRMECPCRI